MLKDLNSDCTFSSPSSHWKGMHELLAPLVFVLYADLDYLSKVRGLYVDYFNDELDGLSYPDSDLVSHYKIKKAKSWDLGDNGDLCQGNESKVTCLDDLDRDTRDVYLLSDANGAEGELSVVISERFTEHDAYNMFDALMGGAQGWWPWLISFPLPFLYIWHRLFNQRNGFVISVEPHFAPTR